MDSDATSAGQRIAQRFLLLSILGKGGNATVWLARDLERDLDVALKLPLRPVRASVAARERFRRECEVLASLEHPGLCPVLDFDADGRVPWLAMPIAEGIGLNEAMSSHASAETSFRPSQCLRILGALFRAIAAAHEKGVTHRDLKPSNVLVALSETEVGLKVLDFGLARILGSETSDQTTVGRVIGTYTYMSPEQATGERVDERTDVFALAVISYELLTLRRAWLLDDDGQQRRAYVGHGQLKGPNAPTLLAARMQQGFIAPASRFRPSLSRDIDEVLAKGVARDLEHRPKNAGMFWDLAGPLLEAWADTAEDEETLDAVSPLKKTHESERLPETAVRLTDATPAPETTTHSPEEFEIHHSPPGRHARRRGAAMVVVAFLALLSIAIMSRSDPQSAPANDRAPVAAQPDVRAVVELQDDPANAPPTATSTSGAAIDTATRRVAPIQVEEPANTVARPRPSGRRASPRRATKPEVATTNAQHEARRLRISLRTAETAPDRLARGTEIGEKISLAAAKIQDARLRARIQALAKTSALMGDYDGLERAISLLESAPRE